MTAKYSHGEAIGANNSWRTESSVVSVSHRVARSAVVCAIVMLLTAPVQADAYIGPGAGFAILSYSFALFISVIAGILLVISWPFRVIWRRAFALALARPKIGRLVVIGFDGQDPTLTDRFMSEGRLPNFARLSRTGAYRRLRTTFPSTSPVAWSSFSTGCEPGRHNIFDFIEPDRRTYLPLIASTRIAQVDRFFKLGRYRFPRQKPDVRLSRKSKPFWTILGEHRIWSTVLRVPITFPPDRFFGAQLSGTCTPDLLGTQSTYTLLTTRTLTKDLGDGGRYIALSPGTDRIDAVLSGPENILVEGAPPLTVRLRLNIDRLNRRVRVDLAGATLTIIEGELSGWIRIAFKAALGIKVHALTRVMLTEIGEHLSLYIAPLNIDPEHPALPISQPSYYATYLAKRIGPFATLGLAEDTSALNDGVIDEDTFLRQTYDINRERECMLFTALDRLQMGSLVCVFDATDRIQHMFWRYLEDARPTPSGAESSRHRTAIRDVYERNDALLGGVLARLRDDDVLMVVSDHGFSSFRRGINLNVWLQNHGYLTLKPGNHGRTGWLRDVDWSATTAYCFGLTGIFLNLAGREGNGIVSRSQAGKLKAEIATKLRGLQDPDSGEVAVRDVFDTAVLYNGPYRDNAPDLLVGCNIGYRVSWECAKGIVAGAVFQDNTKAWSGDHCVDPRLVPGVFFCNRPTTTEDPSLVDIAPTALTLFGIAPPAHMDGRALAGLA